MTERMFKDWTTFEKVWLSVFTVIILYLYFAMNDTLIGLISSFTGMVCVVLVAKGKISNYAFGLVNVLTYAYIAYNYQLYGEVQENLFFYLPMQFYGAYMWCRNRTKSTSGEDIKVNALKPWQTALLSVAIIAAIYGYTTYLSRIGSRAAGLDAATNVLAVVAQTLMTFRFTEQWYVWIATNVISIMMWFQALQNTGGNDYSILVMWIAYLFNSFYGAYNWHKLHNKQQQKQVA